MLNVIFRRLILPLVFIVGCVFQILAQSPANVNWYFGANTSSIRFARPLLDAELVVLPNTLGQGGGAVATDPIKGEILFYTDGINVYNKADVLINAGDPLAGSTTRNQGVAICHDPADPEGDDSRIYIFVINDLGQISFSVYDKSGYFNLAFPAPPNGAMGITNQTNNLPITTLSEGMVIVPNATRDGFWLITHNNGTTTYNITQIDVNGINTPAAVDIPTSPTSVQNISFHQPSNRLAISSDTPGAPLLLDIDQAAGAIIDSGIDLSPLNAQEVYDVDWITSGDSLYVSGNFGNPNDELIRVNLLANPVEIERVITQDIRNSHGLQQGPDGFLYHLYQADIDGLFRLGRLEDPDTTDINQVLYNPTALVNLTNGINFINYAAEQFPAFLPEYDLIQAADFTTSGNCANVPVYFFPQVTPDIDEIFWDFGDGAGTSTAISPAYTYTAGGTYTVTMQLTINGTPQDFTNDIVIQDFDLTIQVDPTQQYWCPQDFPVTYTATAQGNGANNAQFRWSNQTAQEASNIGTFDEPGTYYVVATDPGNGCATYLEQQVIEYGTTNNFANAWYFGNNAGIDFNPLFDQNDPNFGTIQPIPPGDAEFLGGNQIDDGPEGYAIYCDQGGRPIVYSNGAEVYNRDNDQVTADLGGDPNASQSVLITQNPADATIYYIFYTQEVTNQAGNYDFGYAIFDLKLRDGAGDLVQDGFGNILTTTLFSCTSERITGNANWVIVHEWGNNNFRAYPITANGVGSPRVSNVGSIHTLNTSGSTAQGYMKLNGTRLGVTLSESGSQNFIEVFDFDLTTGAVTENLIIDVSPETGQIYGLEFSTENLFATLRNSNGGTKVLWWDFIDNTVDPVVPLDEAAVNASVITVVEENAIDLGAMQIGPDGTIYIANDGATNLAGISNPESEPTSNATAAEEVGYNLSTPPALGATSRLGLPNFVDFNGSSNPSPSLAVSSGCQGDVINITVLNPLNDPDREIESYVVIIRDPNGTQVFSASLDEENPATTFNQTQTTGIYTAEFYIVNQCNSDVPLSTFTFTINPLPTATIVSTTEPSACGIPDGTATVDFTGTGTSTYSLAGPVGIAGVVIDANATGEVISNLAAGQYTLTVISNDTGCDNTVNFSINDPVPYTVVLSENTPADCNDENGLLSFTINGPAPAGYSWIIRDVATNSFIEGGDQSDNVPDVTVGAGDYYITTRDLSGCVVVANATITAPPLLNISVDAGPFSACDEESVTINVTTDGTNNLELYEIVGNTISSTQSTNFSIIGANDSIRMTNPGTGSGIYNYALVIPGELTGPCTNFTTFSVSFGSSSPSPFVTRAAICPDEVIFDRTFASFSNQPDGFQSVRWFTADGTEIVQAPNDTLSNVPGYTFSRDGSVINAFLTEPLSATLTNLEGCITETTINIIEDCEARMNAPTAFSPNGDGINDGFMLFPFLVAEEDFQIFIFNRWGEMIFQSSDLAQMTTGEGWNGGYDNDESRPLTGGTYAYKVVFKNSAKPEQEAKEQRGGITLIR